MICTVVYHLNLVLALRCLRGPDNVLHRLWRVLLPINVQSALTPRLFMLVPNFFTAWWRYMEVQVVSFRPTVVVPHKGYCHGAWFGRKLCSRRLQARSHLIMAFATSCG